jgi:hypothetical protein
MLHVPGEFVRSSLRELKGTPLSSDPALYVWRDSNGNVSLVLSTHVDDIKGCGHVDVVSFVASG